MLGNCTSLPDPYGADLLLSMIQRGTCGVRERNRVVGNPPPLPEVPASSRCFGFLCIMWFNVGLVCGFVVSVVGIVVVSPPTMIATCLLATLSRQDDDDLLDLSLLLSYFYFLLMLVVVLRGKMKAVRIIFLFLSKSFKVEICRILAWHFPLEIERIFWLVSAEKYAAMEVSSSWVSLWFYC
ncbi:hypothetical protein HanIR_Chr08g0365841 [Helianthus annuus]|nr:hypothetical protein HanIR_Chr08g0365841 [Helianthus annuus]